MNTYANARDNRTAREGGGAWPYTYKLTMHTVNLPPSRVGEAGSVFWFKKDEDRSAFKSTMEASGAFRCDIARIPAPRTINWDGLEITVGSDYGSAKP